MALKTWEIVKALTENPKLKFRRINDGLVFTTETKIRDGQPVSYYISKLIPLRSHESILVDDEWELVREPVSFMAAIQAFANGKTIRCEWDGLEHETSIYKPRSFPHDDATLKDQENGSICALEILNGKWYIEP